MGAPLATQDIVRERLPKWKALAVFSSDALSSVAYAPQEILAPLVGVSAAATIWSLPISIAIIAVLGLVAGSYWQTIKAYPQGGGAYIVARENVGITAALVAGAALLIDYVLTVAVSASAGVAAITSAVPALYPYRVVLGCSAVGLVTLINLRGVRESSNVFSIPTYLFIVCLTWLILMGIGRVLTGSLTSVHPLLHEEYPSISLLLILKAFSSGCAALTGIEAISDGVGAFREPAAKNARLTLVWMAVILASIFLGTTALAHLLGITPKETETIVSQIARQVFGESFFYYLVQVATAMILFLAANTSYADFPRICSFLANDRFMPRQLASLGDRLVYSKGIHLLGLISGLLLILFQGDTHRLIPLYAVGVFLTFTISQWGVVKHHWSKRDKGWLLGFFFSGLGTTATLLAFGVIAITKFAEGAWLVALFIVTLVLWFRITREHYRRAGMQLALTEHEDLRKPIKHTVIVPVSGVHRGVIDAIRYARSISKDVRVVYVELDEDATDRMKAIWAKLDIGLPLVVLKSPYRSVIRPIVDYIRAVDREYHDDMLTVVIPEFVTARWWQRIYHNQTSFLIKAALLFEPGKIVTTVRYHLER